MNAQITGFRSIFIALAAITTSACGGSGGNSSANDPVGATPQPPVADAGSITGAVSKGPLVGSEGSFIPIDATGADAGAAVATATTDADGRFSVVLPPGNGTVLIRTSGGTYVDEADREPDPALKRKITLNTGEGLESLLPAGSTDVTVSIATNAILNKTRRESQGDDFLHLFTGNRALATSAYGFDIVTTIPTNPVSPDSGASLAQRQYAMLLGGLANLVNRVTLGVGLAEPTIDTINAVVKDLSDGRIDGMEAGVPVIVNGMSIDVFSLNEEITRFRNNNFDAYADTPLITVNENTLSLPAVPMNTPPIANADDGYQLGAGGTLLIQAPGVLFNDIDAENDELTAVLVSGPANAVDFDLMPDGQFIYIHDGGVTRTDSFSYRANDGAADSNIAIVTLTIIDPPPNSAPIANDDAMEVPEGGSQSMLLSGSDSVLTNDADAEQDPLTAVLVSGPTNAADFDLSADGTFSYVHDGSETTIDSFTYVANDGMADSMPATVTITVIPVNDAPEGNDDNLTVAQGGAQTLLDSGETSVLANDFDAEQDQLTAVLVSGPVNAADFDLRTDGTFIYVHDDSNTSSDTFTYIANDGNADSNVTTVFIVVTPRGNSPPVANDDAMQVDEGATGTILIPDSISVLDNDFDPDQDPLTAVLVDPPVNGQLMLNTDGTLSYAHDGSETTSDAFTYVANDGIADSAPATVTITVMPVNDAPMANDDSLTVAEGGSQTTLDSGEVSVLANDADAEQGQLTAALVSGPVNAADFTLNPDGTFIYVHDDSETTSDSFTYLTNDGMTDSMPATVTITVSPVNDAPVGNDDNLTVEQGGTQTLLDSGEDSVLFNDTDAEFDPLTAVLIDPPLNGQVTLNTDGTFVYEQDGSASQEDRFRYVANDGNADSDITTVFISITPNTPPVAQDDEIEVGEGGTQIVLTSDDMSVLDNDFDDDQDPLTVLLVSAPVNAADFTLNPDGTFSYTHDGSETLEDAFTYVANDGIDDSNEAVVSILVFPVNDPPVADEDSMIVAEGGTQTLLASGNASVLDNDDDAERDPLTAILIDDVVNGDLMLNDDGTFSYTHDGSETTSDSFTYVANDGSDDSNVAQVDITITPVNDPPIGAEDSITVGQGNTATMLDSGETSVLANDFDPEMDPLTALLQFPPANGDLVLNPDGTFSYTHDGGLSISDSFTYFPSDGVMSEAPVAVDITIIPTQPTRTWINPLDGEWDDPGNWSPFGLPQPDEAVIIDLPADGPVITLAGGTVADVFSIFSSESLVFQGGSTLTVHDAGAMQGSIVMEPDSILFADGPDADVLVSGNVDISGGDLIVTGGGSLTVQLINNDQAYYTESMRTWSAGGPGSSLVIPDVFSIDVGVPTADQGSRLSINATNGGVVDLPVLNQMVVTDGTSAAQLPSGIDLAATGPDSRIQLLQMQSFVDSDPDGDISGLSSLTAQNGGVIEVPMLTDPVHLGITIDATSTIDISQLTSLTDGALTLDGVSFSFPDLTVITGSSLNLGSDSGIAVIDLSAVTMFDNSSVGVFNGTDLSLPGVTSYAFAETILSPDRPMGFWSATSGGRLTFPNLITVQVAGNDNGPFWFIDARVDGVIDLPVLTELTVLDDGGSLESNLFVEASGPAARVQMPQLTTLIDSDPSGTFFADLSQLLVSDGAVIEVPSLTATDRVGIAIRGADMNTGQLMTVTNGGLDLEDGVFSFPSLFDLNGSTVFVRAGANVDLMSVISIDNGGAWVSGGAVLSLPGVNSYVLMQNAGLLNTQTWSAEGMGSRLEFPSLNSVELLGNLTGPNLTVQAVGGGVVDLPVTDSLTVADNSGDLSDIVLLAQAANSLIDLPVLGSFFDFDDDSPSLIFEIDNGVVNFPPGALLINVQVIQNQSPFAINLSNDTVEEGLPPGTPVGIFTTMDPDAGDTHVYSLVPGNNDNDSFQIVGDQLQTATVLDAMQSPLIIRVLTNDRNGGLFEESFTIAVTP